MIITHCKKLVSFLLLYCAIIILSNENEVHSFVMTTTKTAPPPTLPLNKHSSSSATNHNALLKASSESRTILSKTYDDDEEEENHILKSIGVPETIGHLKIGQSLNAFRQSIVSYYDKDDYNKYENDVPQPQHKEQKEQQAPIITTKTNFTIERVSYNPDVFILKNLLTPFECDSIMDYTMKHTTMTNAETITKNDISSRKHCKVSWLPSSPASSSVSKLISFLVSNLVSTTANILLSKEVLNHPSAGVEDLQVLKYDTGGEFVLHHDGEPRILTVIYYGKLKRKQNSTI